MLKHAILLQKWKNLDTGVLLLHRLTLKLQTKATKTKAMNLFTNYHTA